MNLFVFSLITLLFTTTWAVDWDAANWPTLAADDVTMYGPLPDPNYPPSLLYPRAPGYVDLGNGYWRLMRYTDQQAGTLLGDTRTPPSAASVFDIAGRSVTYREWGWNEHPTEPYYTKNFQILGWYNPGPARYVDKWTFKKFVHGKEGDGLFSEQKYLSGLPTNAVFGRMWRVATGGTYQFAYYNNNDMPGRRGIVIFTAGHPKQAAKVNWQETDVAEDQLPHIQHISDFLYLEFSRLARGQSKPKPEWIGYNGVSDRMTLSILARILVLRGSPVMRQYEHFTGIVEISEPEGQALLATPVGKIVTYLLTRRKNEWGRMHVVRWKFWMGSPRQTDGAMLPNIVAYIDSVQPQDEINDIWAPCAQPPNKFPWSKFRRQVESWQDKTRLNNVTQQNEGKNVLREHIIHV